MKKNLERWLVAITLLGYTTACKDAKTEKSSVTPTAKAEVDSSLLEGEISENDKMSAILNVNLATESDLNKIGLASEVITTIIEKRPFLTMSAFDALIGSEIDKTELYKKVFVPFNLNTTAEADFKMIPGVGNRMAHEFKEYRPYKSMAQFHREIGKYVDKDEVARYENYVFVPIELNTATETDIKALPGVGNRMAHEFEEYRPYVSMAQFRKEIGKYVDDKELNRLERLVYLKE